MAKENLTITLEEAIKKDVKAYSDKTGLTVSKILADSYVFFRQYLYLVQQGKIKIDKDLYGITDHDYEGIPLNKKKYDFME